MSAWPGCRSVPGIVALELLGEHAEQNASLATSPIPASRSQMVCGSTGALTSAPSSPGPAPRKHATHGLADTPRDQRGLGVVCALRQSRPQDFRSSSFFLAWPPPRTAIQLYVQSVGHLFGPLRRTKWSAAPQRASHGRQLGFALHGANLGSPPPPPFGVGLSQFLPLRNRTEQGVVLLESVVGEAGPSIFGQVRRHFGPKRSGFDVPQDHQQVRIVLDNGALGTALKNWHRSSRSPSAASR